MNNVVAKVSSCSVPRDKAIQNIGRATRALNEHRS
jgi:hypothetical protein